MEPVNSKILAHVWTRIFQLEELHFRRHMKQGDLTLQKEKAELADLVIQQSTAINALKEEAIALRRDMAFVGNHVNITVTPSNPYVEELPPLPELAQQQQAVAHEEPAAHMLGISPSNDVRPLLPDCEQSPLQQLSFAHIKGGGNAVYLWKIVLPQILNIC